MKTAEQIARETLRGEHWQAVDPYGVWEERRGEELVAAITAAIEADRAQHDTDWQGTRPVLMRKGATIVYGTRMGPWGGVAVSGDSIGRMDLPSSVPGYFNDFRPPYYAELPDSEWSKIGWTITEARA